MDTIAVEDHEWNHIAQNLGIRFKEVLRKYSSMLDGSLRAINTVKHHI